jgi:hypothetical protein
MTACIKRELKNATVMAQPQWTTMSFASTERKFVDKPEVIGLSRHMRV